MSELSTVATATNKLTSKLDAASDAAEQFVSAGKVISEKSDALGSVYAQVTEDMQNVAKGTKEYEAKVAGVAKQLTSLNAVYELQLQTLQKQVEAYKAQTEKGSPFIRLFTPCVNTGTLKFISNPNFLLANFR